MDIARAKQYVTDTVRAYLQTDEDGMPVIAQQLQRPLFLVGPPGIGKTAIMAQVARELGIGLVAYSMTHHTRQSALGLPVIEHHDFEGFEFDASEYTMSEIIASIYEYMQRTGLRQGILFLDEVNCVSETLYPSMLQFLQFKTFGKHAVPQGWIIACAGNPQEYNRSVHEFDIATMDRVRRIDVEPDVDAWRAYAANAGVHPAVTTFLEAEKGYFYRVEQTPDGKKFATARGWDDLSRMIALNEQMGIPVEQGLVEQFVQDAEIAEKFALYYELFRKYQSDYQVPAILEGLWPQEIVGRAQAAQLDERMALLGLIMDTLAPRAADIMLREGALTDVRDVLRDAKARIAGGEDAGAVLQPALDELAAKVRRLGEAGGREDELRRALRAERVLKACRNAGGTGGAAAGVGAAAFDAVHQEFRGFVGAFEHDVATFRAQLENAFAFLDEAFGDGREMLLFTTELTANAACALFISRFECEAFGRASQELQVAQKHDDLLERIEGALEGQNGSAGADVDAGIEPGGTFTSKSTVSAGQKAAVPSHDDLSAYYDGACWEYGYASLCHMALPRDLDGKVVLDVGCRRGKGIFKLHERVGMQGRAIGLDWVPDHIAEATSRSERAARETGLPSANMEFHLGYPEDLMALGLGDGTVDVAFTNSILHLTCDPHAALAEMHRVLKPGGLLILEVALATGPRDVVVVEEARRLGNSIQAAPERAAFEAELAHLGFTVEVAEAPHEVQPAMNFKRDLSAPTAPSTEHVGFEALVLHAVK